MNLLLESVIEVVLAGLLVMSSLAKLLDLRSWRLGLQAYRLRLLRKGVVVYGMPLVELAIAIAFGVGIEPLADGLGAVLFFAFALTLTAAYLRGSRGECNCFGEFLSSRVGPVAIARAGLLCVAAMLAAALGESAGIRTAQLALALGLGLALLVTSELRRMLTAV